MLFQIYRAEVDAQDGDAIFNVVAPCPELASEVIQAHYSALELRVRRVTVTRFDDTLGEHQTIGLDQLLSNGPTGLAHYHQSLGWIVYEQSLQRLRLFTIEEPDDRITYVVAPTPDLASALWSVSLPQSDVGTRYFMISDSLDRLSAEQRQTLDVFLVAGSAGVVDWQGGRGWVRA
jgi:hypothetical protein